MQPFHVPELHFWWNVCLTGNLTSSSVRRGGNIFSSKKCFFKSYKKKPPQVPAGKRPEGRGCSQQRGSAPVYLDNSDNLNTFLPFDNRLFFKQRFCDHISVFLKMGLKTFNVLIDKEDINTIYLWKWGLSWIIIIYKLYLLFGNTLLTLSLMAHWCR